MDRECERYCRGEEKRVESVRDTVEEKRDG